MVRPAAGRGARAGRAPLPRPRPRALRRGAGRGSGGPRPVRRGGCGGEGRDRVRAASGGRRPGGGARGAGPGAPRGDGHEPRPRAELPLRRPRGRVPRRAAPGRGRGPLSAQRLHAHRRDRGDRGLAPGRRRLRGPFQLPGAVLPASGDGAVPPGAGGRACGFAPRGIRAGASVSSSPPSSTSSPSLSRPAPPDGRCAGRRTGWRTSPPRPRPPTA